MGTLQRLTIAGYRGFQQEQRLELANRRKECPALTILVGPNGGGKSSILEALELVRRAAPGPIPEGQANRGTNYLVRITGQWDDGYSITLQSTEEDTTKLTVTSQKPEKRSSRTVPLRRGVSREIGPQSSWTQHAEKSLPLRSRSYNETTLQTRIRAMAQPENGVIKILRERFDINLRVFAANNTFNIRIDNAEHPPEGLGEGIIYLLNILDALYDAPDNALILIDEPEAALHPSFIRELFKLLREERRIQIVYATHSPYMIDFPTLLAGAKLARIVHEPEGCKIYQPQQETLDAFRTLVDNFCNPHTLGVAAAEAFVLRDRVILVEGQDDVVYYQRMAEQTGTTLNGQFFGWGAGGAGNMPRFATLLHDLGFKKVIGILDHPHEDQCRELNEQFPEYCFRTIPTDDVRDKDEKGIKGICTKNGQIHDEHKDTVKELMTWINDKL